MPKEETIEMRHVRNIIGETSDLPSLNPRVSLVSRIRSLITKSFGVPQLIHLYGALGLNSTLTLNTGENGVFAFYSDGTYLYVGLGTSPGKIVKIDLETFTAVSTVTLDTGENDIRSLVSDGKYLYATTYLNPMLTDGFLVKIDLATFTKTATLTLPGTPTIGTSFSDGTYLYLGVSIFPGKIIKIDLDTFTIDSTLTLAAGEDNVTALWSDGLYLYAGLSPATGIGYAIKINLSTFVKVSTLTLSSADTTALFSDGIYLYAVNSNPPGIVKIDLITFTEIAALTLSAAGDNIYSLFSSGTYLFVGTDPNLYIIDLNTFTEIVKTTQAGVIFSLFSDGTYLFMGLGTTPAQIVRQYLIPSADLHQRKIDTITLNTENLVANSVASVTNGTYTHANNMNEQDLLEFTAAIQDINIYLDMTNITQTSTIREYIKVDGVNYRQLSAKVFPTDFDTSSSSLSLLFKQPNRAYKVTLQSGVAEGSAKDIIYSYRTEARS